MGDFAPTDEQTAILDAFRTGQPVVAKALAGTGKTTALRLLADSTNQRGQYLAFNKAIVEEGKKSFPANMGVNTAHSLAFTAVGHKYGHRIRTSQRQRAADIARALRLDPIAVTKPDGTRRDLSPGFLAGHTMRALARFCQTADPAPTRDHFGRIEGIDGVTGDGRRKNDNNRMVATHCEPALRRAWADIQNLDGQLRFEHGHYLKMWQLEGPRIPARFVLFDEAQDANPVMLAIVAAQTHAQRVYVGDDHQQIYSFTGAVNALSSLDGAEELFLTQSFRFGPAIAAVANDVLRLLAASKFVVGTPTVGSHVGDCDDPQVILTRTNAAAVRAFLHRLAVGERPYLTGGADDVGRFCRAAIQLRDDGWTGHPELACFAGWGEVLEYVAQDPQGGELKLLVDLITEFGAEQILAGLDRMPTARNVSIEISTAHKAKGREWDRVALADDFPRWDDEDEPPPDPEELRLLYVAVTRARLHLDVSQVPLLTQARKAAA